MDIGNLSQLGSFVLSAVALICAGLAWWRKADDKLWQSQIEKWGSNHIDHERFWSKANDHDGRISRLETEFAHLPSSTVVGRLETTMVRLEGEMKVLQESLKPIAGISHRLQDFLFEQGSRKHEHG